MSDPLVSIVIPTLNRNSVLCDTVASVLAAEAGTDFELLILDQTDGNTTSCFADPRVTYIRLPEKGLTKARNEGIRRSRGDIIVFLDDDVLIAPGFLAAHMAPYADQQVWVVTGPSLKPGERIAYSGDGPCSWARGCNMSVRRDAAIAVGGFDEHFRESGIGEDAEFCVRIRRAGGIVYYTARASLVHLEEPTGGCRTTIGTAAIRSHAYNTHYFSRIVEGTYKKLALAVLRSYRRYVFNKRHILHPAKHIAFFAGVIEAQAIKRRPPHLTV